MSEDDHEREESPESDGDNIQERCLGHVGQSGSGKTYALEEDSLERCAEGRRMLVIDAKREWTAVPPGQIICENCAVTGKEAQRQKCGSRGSCVICPDHVTAEKRFKETGFAVIRPLRDLRLGPQRRDEVTLLERVAYFALNVGDLDIVVPEMHMHLSLEDDGAMGIQTKQLITQFRSYGIALAYDTQQFASVSMRLRKQTNTWRFFGVASGTPDMAQMQKIGGADLVHTIEECSAKHAKGEPGWHVYVDPREPPVNPKAERY